MRVDLRQLTAWFVGLLLAIVVTLSAPLVLAQPVAASTLSPGASSTATPYTYDTSVDFTRPPPAGATSFVYDAAAHLGDPAGGSGRVPRASSGSAALTYTPRGTTFLDDAVTTVGSKISGQMGSRGWSQSLIDDTLAQPSRTVITRDTRWTSVGTRLDDPATAYIRADGSYVVRNDLTGDIVQISNRNDANWIAPWD